MEFHAFHGVLDSERQNGNVFRVDFEGTYRSVCATSDNLEETIDYSKVFSIVSELMSEPCKLMETVAAEICDKLAADMPGFTRIKVKISKKEPPVGGKCEWSSIMTEWEKE